MADAFQMIETNGIRLRARVEGEGPLVVMVHGFPESWYSWRHQIPVVANAGYKVAAIDVRGYGGSEKPHEIYDYSMKEITADIAGIPAAMGYDKAILMGHDWGAPLVWHTSLYHPDQVSAVAALSVPYTGLGPASTVDMADKIFTQNNKFFYQVYFQKEGEAEADLEDDVRTTLRRLYYVWSAQGGKDWPRDKAHGEKLLTDIPDPDPFPSWMSEAEIDYYVSEFEASGFRGPLNKYRTHKADYELLKSQTDHKIYQPALFIGGDKDPVLKMIPGRNVVDIMKPNVPNLMRAVVLDNCGHWTQQEKPEEVNRLLLEWLDDLKSA